MRIGVLALQGDVREHLQALADSGADAVPVRRVTELDDVDGLVIPGGESTTIAKLAVAFDLLEPLRKRIAGGLPAYGSCAGMILLADRVLEGVQGQQTLGGLDVTVRRNAFGRQVDSFEEWVARGGGAGGGGAGGGVAPRRPVPCGVHPRALGGVGGPGRRRAGDGRGRPRRR